MRIGILVFLCLISIEFSFAQEKQADWWYFGMFAGLHFSNAGPVAVTDGALNTSEGCSTISDTSGNLLFYTDGVTVYTRQHTAMPNSGDLLGNISTTQSALIVPTPGNPNQFYIFTLPDEGGSDGFRYSVVDLTLNGGLGDVTQKNVFIKSNATEKVSAVGNYSGTAYWVMMHEWGTDAFYAYQVTSSGFNATPVVSHAGTVHSNSQTQDTHGQMKFSPDGKKVAVGIGYQGIFEVLDFDNRTGIVSNPITIHDGDQAYGVEFSPDNTKLYVNYVDLFNQTYNLDQFDISSGDETTIIGSKVAIAASDEEIRALQLGPDKKLYVAVGFLGTLGVITDPNAKGIACNFEQHGVDLAGETSELGLPGFPQSFFGVPPIAAFSSSDTTFCADSCLSFTDLSLNNPTSWNWTFAGSDSAFSTQQNPTNICFHTPGTFKVLLTVGNASGTDTASLTLIVKDCALPIANFNASSDSICNGSCIDFIDSSLNADTYQWSFPGGNPASSTAATPPQICYSANGNYPVTLIVSNVNGNDTAQKIINVHDCTLPVASFVASQNGFCSGTCIDFKDSSTNATSYLWTFEGATPGSSTDQNPTSICFDSSGTFTVTLIATNQAGSDTDSIAIDVKNCNDLFLPNAFSPNGDGINDIFYVLGNNSASIVLQIFNRWGEKIFETHSIAREDGWRGDYKGVPQDVGVYIYVLKAVKEDGTEVLKKGNVTLIR